MGKKAREAREKKLLLDSKTREQRAEEMKNIRQKLQNLGLTSEQENMNKIEKVMNDFIETGYSNTIDIKLPGTQRVCQMKLANRKNSESIVNLAFRSEV